MKKVLIIFITLLIIVNTQSQNVGIGTFTPAASAQLDISSTSKGLLPPRMTITQRNAIPNPAIALVIFCSDCDELQVFNGTVWKNMAGAAGCVSPTLPFVNICSQVWMTKNLDVDKYRDGTPIPKVTDPTAWEALITGAYCYYNNDSITYAATYGKLYNWYAVNDLRGLAPAGWHVPTDAEWTTLETCLGGSSVAGGKMKETGTIHWLSPNTEATNSSGFTGLPGGDRYGTGPFHDVGQMSQLWSSTEVYTNAWVLALGNGGGASGLGYTSKTNGFSVRCLRD